MWVCVFLYSSVCACIANIIVIVFLQTGRCWRTGSFWVLLASRTSGPKAGQLFKSCSLSKSLCLNGLVNRKHDGHLEPVAGFFSPISSLNKHNTETECFPVSMSLWFVSDANISRSLFLFLQGELHCYGQKVNLFLICPLKVFWKARATWDIYISHFSSGPLFFLCFSFLLFLSPCLFLSFPYCHYMTSPSHIPLFFCRSSLTVPRPEFTLLVEPPAGDPEYLIAEINLPGLVRRRPLHAYINTLLLAVLEGFNCEAAASICHTPVCGSKDASVSESESNSSDSVLLFI